MRVVCIKTCEGMSAGQRGTFKGLSSANHITFMKVELDSGRMIRVPVSCCEFVKTKVSV